jgi:hypothetical protein
MPSPILTPNGDADWEAFARTRMCYCSVWGKDPSLYEEKGLTPGFCGKCERCGAMGHMRHYPGAVPYTGSWCDRCYRIVGLTGWLNGPIGWIIVLAFLIWAVSKVFK